MTTTLETDNADELLSDAFARDDRDSGATIAAPDASQPRHPDGTFAPKDGEQPEPPAQQQAQPEPQPVSPPQQSDKRNHRVPLHELEAEREKRKAIETAKAEAEERATRYERELQHLRQQLPQQRQPQQQYQQPQQQPIPDPVTDPDGYTAYVEARIEHRILNERANLSERQARTTFGDAVVDAAFNAAPPQVLAAVQRSADPYGQLVEWHKRASFMQKVGPDPSAYEKSIEERATQKVLADLRAGKLKLDGQAPPQTRFPGTLADNTATGAQTAHYSDEAMMADAFSRRR